MRRIEYLEVPIVFPTMNAWANRFRTCTACNMNFDGTAIPNQT